MSTSEFDTTYKGDHIVVSVDNETGHVVDAIQKINKRGDVCMGDIEFIEIELENHHLIQAILNENETEALELESHIKTMTDKGRYL